MHIMTIIAVAVHVQKIYSMNRSFILLYDTFDIEYWLQCSIVPLLLHNERNSYLNLLHAYYVGSLKF